MATSAASSAVAQHVLALDPTKSFHVIYGELERSSQLDRKVAEARMLVSRRLTEVATMDDRDVLAPLLWLQLRVQLKTLSPRGFGLLLGNGEVLLRTVQQALGTTLSRDVLANAIQEVTQMAASATACAQELDEARRELERLNDLIAEDNPLLIAAAAGALAAAGGLVVGAAIAEYVHHHGEHH